MTNDVTTSIREAVASSSQELGFEPDKEASGFANETSEPVKVAEPEKVAEKTETKPEGADEGSIIEPAEIEAEAATPAKEPEKAVVETEGEEEFTVSPEELAVIEKDPGLKKIHRSMVRGFTEKTKALSAQKKEYEADHQAIEALKKDPQGVLKQMVEAAGLKLVEPPASAISVATEADIDAEIIALLKANIGAEAATVLGPALVKVVKTVTGRAIAPIQEDNEKRVKSEGELRLKSEIANFGTRVVADGGDWDESIEQEMAQMVGKVIPGKGVTLPEYLTVLHNNVQTNRRAKEGAIRETTRLKKAREKDEPVRPTRPAPTNTETGITAGMNPKEATILALAAARRELSGR